MRLALVILGSALALLAIPCLAMAIRADRAARRHAKQMLASREMGDAPETALSLVGIAEARRHEADWMWCACGLFVFAHILGLLS